MGHLDKEEFHVKCLSLTEETYIASNLNSFVVQLRKSPANTFRKKPLTIEAMQYTGNNGATLNKWSGGKVIESPVLEPTDDNPTGEYVQIKTIDTDKSFATAVVGDWVCKGIKGEFHPCKNEIFEESYEKAEIGE